MTTGIEWQDQAGRSWAAAYAQTDRSFAEMTAQFLERLAEAPGRAVLDIGCGAGELALALARARPDARVIGLDISADLIEAARARVDAASAAGFAGLAFELGDAGAWFRKDFAPDLLVSRHGVMFFADPVAAFAHLRAIAAPQGNLAFTCFREQRLNPWATGLAALLAGDAAAQSDPFGSDPFAPGPFAFADPARVEAILYRAGWRDVACEPLDFVYVAGRGDDPVADAMGFFSRIGPAARDLRGLPEVEREALMARMASWLEANRHGDEVSFAGAAWLVTAGKA